VTVKAASLKQKPLSAKWRKLLRLIPGYDPFAQAEGYWFDVQAATNALEFFPECIKHVEGANAGEPFTLEPWEQCIVANLFGWKRKDNDARRFREVFIYLPRGNGKTAFVAAIAIYIFFCDKEAAQQDYIAAGEREQAGFLFRHIKGMVQQEPELMNRCRIYGGNAAAGQSKSLVREEDGSFLRVIAADGDTQHGGNTHLAVIDEVHVQKNRELFEAFRTSMAKKNRLQPLLIGITTADFARESLCNEWHGRACKVRDNGGDKSKPGYDPAFLPVIYETLRDEDWTDEKVWERANPNIDISVSREELRRECKEAQENPASENSFRRLHLNQKTEQDCRVIPMDQWEKCGYAVDPVAWREQMLVELMGRQCTAGLDLGSVSDLTALALLFGDDDEGYDVLPFFWTPEHNAHERERKDSVPYLAWVRQGFLTMNDGNETDYQLVRREINELGERYGIEIVAADRLFQGFQFCQDLIRDGFNVEAFGQGYVSMAAPTRRFLELVAAGKLRHGNNPVLRWMASNAATEQENAGNGDVLKFSKRKSPEKIDGIISTTMALGLRMKSDLSGNRSIYDRESRGFIEIG
jgi:phage terminase large subunit-like protein